MHDERAVRCARPGACGTVAVELHSVAVRIAQIDRLAYAVVGGPCEGDAVPEHAPRGRPKGLAVGVQNREVVQPGRPRGGSRRAAPRPGVEPDVVVVAARRQEHRLPTVASRHLETQDVAIERERALEVRNGEVDVPDMHAWVDGCHESALGYRLSAVTCGGG